MEALGKSRGEGDSLFLQRGVQKIWGGRGKGSGDSLVSQLSQQGLKRVKSLGRETACLGLFPCPAPVFIVLVHVKACWVLEALRAPGAVCCCWCVSLDTGGELGACPWPRLGRKSCLNERGVSSGLESCDVPFL